MVKKNQTPANATENSKEFKNNEITINKSIVFVNFFLKNFIPTLSLKITKPYFTIVYIVRNEGENPVNRTTKILILNELLLGGENDDKRRSLKGLNLTAAREGNCLAGLF